MTEKENTWTALVKPHVDRFNLAAKLGCIAVYNAEGSKAMAQLLTTLATALDELNKSVVELTQTKKDQNNGKN